MSSICSKPDQIAFSFNASARYPLESLRPLREGSIKDQKNPGTTGNTDERPDITRAISIVDQLQGVLKELNKLLQESGNKGLFTDFEKTSKSLIECYEEMTTHQSDSDTAHAAEQLEMKLEIWMGEFEALQEKATEEWLPALEALQSSKTQLPIHHERVHQIIRLAKQGQDEIWAMSSRERILTQFSIDVFKEKPNVTTREGRITLHTYTATSKSAPEEGWTGCSTRYAREITLDPESQDTCGSALSDQFSSPHCRVPRSLLSKASVKAQRVAGSLVRSGASGSQLQPGDLQLLARLRQAFDDLASINEGDAAHGLSDSKWSVIDDLTTQSKEATPQSLDETTCMTLCHDPRATPSARPVSSGHLSLL